MKTVKMSNYSFSKDGYPELEKICKEYNYKSVAIIGGKRALSAVSSKIKKALLNSGVELLGEFVYGDECTMANVNKLASEEEVQKADVIFSVGGGKALDTGKVLANKLNKPTFSFPTICSNCAAVTAIAVLYKDDKKFSNYELVPAPTHMFIDIDTIAKAPKEYLWAGIGDGLSKQPEVAYATKGCELDHTATMGLNLSKSCEKAFLKYGKQAIEDCEKNEASKAVEEIAMDILVSTGYVSNLTNQPEYYYNSSIAHIFYNISTAIERAGEYLHGELVAFGVMVLHAYAEDFKELEKIAKFNKEVGLPTTLEEIGLDKSHIENMVEFAPETTEWKSAKNPLRKDKLVKAIENADLFGKSIA